MRSLLCLFSAGFETFLSGLGTFWGRGSRFRGECQKNNPNPHQHCVLTRGNARDFFFDIWTAPVYGAIPNWKCDASSHVSVQCKNTRTSQRFSAERKCCSSDSFDVRIEFFVDVTRARMFQCNAKVLGRLNVFRLSGYALCVLRLAFCDLRLASCLSPMPNDK